MTQFILIRHGETLWNEQKKYQGESDLSLSQNGKRSIRKLSKAVQQFGVDVLYTSPLKRARQSAAIISSNIGIKPMSDSRLKEMSFGLWEGKISDELISAKDKDYLRWLKGRWPSPGGESLGDLRRRVRRFVKDCLKNHPGKKIVIVSHGGPLRMIINLSRRQNLKSLFSFSLEPSSLVILSRYSRKWSPAQKELPHA